MKTLKLKINVLSDMCCATGTGNGSNVDLITAFDEYGLPVIPAKRIKGLLRECGQQLVDECPGFLEQEEIIKIFGGNEGKSGLLRVNNAVIENYEIIKNELFEKKNEFRRLLTKANTQECFTCLRSQTEIEDNGIAKDKSLRTIQMIKKGIQFTSTLILDSDEARDYEILSYCTQLLRNIGLCKTRGYGEVQCSLSEINNKTRNNYTYNPEGVISTVKYSIKLLDDIVISAGSNKSKDYISGAMLIGAFAKYTQNFGWFPDVILNNTIFSNAYIADGNMTFYPVPFSIHKIKNKDGTAFNLASSDFQRADVQYVPFDSYAYISSDKIVSKSVDESFEYHYTTGVMGASRNLFTYKKLTKGQVFKGTITADNGALKLIEAILSENDNLLYFGGSQSAQYASCKFTLEGNADISKIKTDNRTIVEFISDVIVTDEFGNFSGNISSLENEIKKLLNFSNCSVYSKTVTIGGFNAKWALPKRQLTAFSKGTTLILSGCECKELFQTGYVGLFNNEGFGQYRLITRLHPEMKVEEYINSMPFEDTLSPCSEKIVKNILFNSFAANVIKQALLLADNTGTAGLQLSNIMRLYTLYQPLKNSKDIQSNLLSEITINFKDKLRDFSNKAAGESFDRALYSCYSLADGAVAKMVVAENKDKLFHEYFRAYISQVKRNFQKEDRQ